MQKASFSDSFFALGNMISRLKEVLEHKELDHNDFIRDAAIQRFEFTIELFWKVLKKVLQHEKIESTTPRDTISKAFQYNLINDEKIWLTMLDDRNNASHAYKEAEAKRIFKAINTYLPVFESSYRAIQDKYKAIL